MEPKVITVQNKPQQCPKCGGTIVDILYGLPTSEAFEMAERKEIVLGGCLIHVEGNPQWACVQCGTQFLEKE